MVVLAIGAHPDDIEFGCYATLAKMAKEGEIHFLVFSCGELGGPRVQRVKESKESAQLIGANIKILDYPDGAIPVNPELIAEVRAYIEKIGPNIIFAPYYNDTHQDHRNASRITISSCANVNKVLFYELPSTEVDFHPNIFYDVTAYFPIKERALNCHRSQQHRQYLDLFEIKGLAQYRAYQCHHKNRLFEAFCLYREIC